VQLWLLIAHIADASIFVPFVLYLLKYKQVGSEDKMLAAFLLITLLRNIAAVSLEVAHAMCDCTLYNLFFYNWHNLLSFSCLSYIYFFHLKSRYARGLIVFANVTVYLVALADIETIIHFQTRHFSENAFILSRIYSIFLLLLFFYQLLREMKVPYLTQNSLFWFSSGGLLYYSGTLFPYLFIKYTFQNSDSTLAQQYWMIDAILSIVFSVALSFSVWYMHEKNTLVK
jgi:hypothetical protein